MVMKLQSVRSEDASTSEGLFWETMNAAGVLQVPMLMNVWDDGYGISVPKEFQTTKGSISQALSGMEKEDHTNGLVIMKVKGWDYPNLIATYEAAAIPLSDRACSRFGPCRGGDSTARPQHFRFS